MTTTLADAPSAALDRCDRCGAQAVLRAVLPKGELFFCGHHARRHAEALAQAGVVVEDERRFAWP